MELKEERGRVGASKRREFLAERAAALQDIPEQDRDFRRPSEKTTDAVWALLAPFMKGVALDSWVSSEIDEAMRGVVHQWGRQAFVIALDRFVQSGDDTGTITFTRFFETIAARFSIAHYHSQIKSIYDMSIAGVRDVRRELVMMGLFVDKLWEAITAWSTEKGKNPLFVVKRWPMAPNAVKLRDSSELESFEGIIVADGSYKRATQRAAPLWRSDAEDPLPQRQAKTYYAGGGQYNIITNGSEGLKSIRAQEGVVLVFDVGAFRKDFQEMRREMMARAESIQSAYGIDPALHGATVWYGLTRDEYEALDEDRREAARLQADRYELPRRSPRATEILFQSIGEALRSGDYERMTDEEVKKELEGEWDPDLESEERESRSRKREKKWEYRPLQYSKWLKDHPEYPPASKLENLVKAFLARAKWRSELYGELAVYDKLRTQVAQFQRVYKDVADEKRDLIPIRSRFYRIINRRFQAQHFWPTSVSAKEDLPGQSPVLEEEYASFRARWFKAHHDEKRVKLVELDISSSQTQILAALLSLKEVEKWAMGKRKKPFKEYLAQRAWGLHRRKAITFRKDVAGKTYTGPKDEALIKLVKVTWMRTLYGSSPYEINRDIARDGRTYGPGWSVKDAHIFLKEIPGYTKIREFFSACTAIAKRSFVQDPYRGVTWDDPFDGAKVRWNPLLRTEYRISVGRKQKLMLGLPGSYVFIRRRKKPKFKLTASRDGEYAVSEDKLRRMMAPCLVHMLDAHFSALVMRKLEYRKVATFVGIHDAWLVPERVNCRANFRERMKSRNGKEVLQEVIEAVAVEWYRGLAGIYTSLQLGLDPDKKSHKKYRKSLEDLAKRYKERLERGYVPKFHAT